MQTENPQAERAVIGACLVSRENLETAAGVLEAGDFAMPVCRAAWDALMGCMRAGEEITALGTLDRMRLAGWRADSGGDLMAFAAEASVVVETDAKLVRKAALARRLMELSAAIARSVRDQETDVEDALARARTDLLAIEAGTAPEPVRLYDGLSGVLDEIESRARTPDAYAVRTGLRAFDNVVGGFRPGQMVVVATRPGMGKSALVGTIAENAAGRGIPVLIFSLEMSFQENAERALSRGGRVDLRKITSGRVEYADWKKLQSQAGRFDGVPLWIDDSPLTDDRIFASARRWRSRYAPEGLAMVVIDYIGLVRAAQKHENRVQQLGAISRGAKLLAKELRLPVVLVSQLNRRVEQEKRAPVLSDLRDSGEIEQDADMVVFPWRDMENADSAGVAQLIVAKNRGGPVGTVNVVWIREYTQFADLAEEPESWVA